MASKLKVVEELQRDGLDAVVERYHLRFNRHTTHPHLVQLKYDQMNSDMSLEGARSLVAPLFLCFFSKPLVQCPKSAAGS